MAWQIYYFSVWIVNNILGILLNNIWDTTRARQYCTPRWKLKATFIKRQRAHMSGGVIQAGVLRNKVNHTASKLRHDFYQTHIASLTAAGSHDWWKHMKTIMGLKTSGNACMQGVTNNIANGDYGILADRMNDFLISVSDKLPRLKTDNPIFTVNNELPYQYVIPVLKTFEALCNVKVRKATGPDNIPAWLLKCHAEVLAPPLTAIFNNSLREGSGVSRGVFWLPGNPPGHDVFKI